MTTSKQISDADYGNRTTLRPPHEYSIPGGVYPRKLGEKTVTILSEISRGGDDDRGAGR